MGYDARVAGQRSGKRFVVPISLISCILYYQTKFLYYFFCSVDVIQCFFSLYTGDFFKLLVGPPEV